MAQQNRTTLKTYFNTGDVPTEAQFVDLIDSFPNPSDDIATAAVYVSKDGNDASSGLTPALPKLTIGSAITAASSLITGGATGVRIEVTDGGTYTETFTVPEDVVLSAPGATIEGNITVSSNAIVDVGYHYAPSTGGNMANRNFTSDGPSFYRAKISDGRGLDGLGSNVTNVRNTAGSNKNFFVEVGVMYVSSNGEGLQDDSDGAAGHIHFRIGDIYLAGASAQGIRAGGATSNIIGYVDRILETGTPTGTRGIHVLNAGAVVKVTACEIVADTAYEISAGDLYLSCPKITGATVGTPTQRMLGTADITAADIPIVDAGSLITATNTETALQEIAGNVDQAQIDIAAIEADYITNSTQDVYVFDASANIGATRPAVSSPVVVWINTGGTGTKPTNALADDIWPTVPGEEIVTDATTTRTLTLDTDDGKTIYFTSGSAVTVTLPLNATQAFAVGTIITVMQGGAGLVTVDAAAGVTLNGTDGLNLALGGQRYGLALRKVATNIWVGSHLIPDLAAFEPADADILKADTADQLTAGFTAAVETVASPTAASTYTPTATAGNVKELENTNAFTLAPPAPASGEAIALTVLIVNGTGAGTVTASGSFSKVVGDSFTTTVGHEFLCQIDAINRGGTTFSALQVIALQ